MALKTEQSYCAWLRRYCQHVTMLPADLGQRTKAGAVSDRPGQNKYQRQHPKSSL